jgi:hypothetical protein
MRSDRAGAIVDIFARSSGVQNRVTDGQRRAARNAFVVDAAAVAEGGRVAAEGAVGDRQRRCVVVDAAGAAAGRPSCRLGCCY